MLKVIILFCIAYSGYSEAKRIVCIPETTASSLIADSAPKAICPDVNWSDTSMTIEDFILSVLQQTGPSDGVCSGENKEVWQVDGPAYKLPSKCVCVPKPNLPGTVMKKL